MRHESLKVFTATRFRDLRAVRHDVGKRARPCPRCGADREGAIFTADALRLADEVPRAGWLVTTVRRNAITSYPSIREQGETAPEPDASAR